MELYAARHGETISNLENRLTGGETDSPLTEKGIAQAKQLAESLEGKAFDAVYCSPLKRAIDTAEIVLGNNYEICVDARLSEIGLGAMNGMTYEEAVSNFPDSGMLFFTNPTLYRPILGAELLQDMIDRVGSFLDDIASRNHKNVFVQTHGYVLRVLYACAVDRSVSAIAKSPGYANCDVVHYTYENGWWKLNK